MCDLNIVFDHSGLLVVKLVVYMYLKYIVTNGNRW